VTSDFAVRTNWGAATGGSTAATQAQPPSRAPREGGTPAVAGGAGVADVTHAGGPGVAGQGFGPQQGVTAAGAPAAAAIGRTGLADGDTSDEDGQGDGGAAAVAAAEGLRRRPRAGTGAQPPMQPAFPPHGGQAGVGDGGRHAGAGGAVVAGAAATAMTSALGWGAPASSGNGDGDADGDVVDVEVRVSGNFVQVRPARGRLARGH
jgi:hypothetical protein